MRAAHAHVLGLICDVRPSLTLAPAHHGAAVMVKGIKIVDADTKSEALKRLRAEQALSLMDTD